MSTRFYLTNNYVDWTIGDVPYTEQSPDTVDPNAFPTDLQDVGLLDSSPVDAFVYDNVGIWTSTTSPARAVVGDYFASPLLVSGTYAGGTMDFFWSRRDWYNTGNMRTRMHIYLWRDSTSSVVATLYGPTTDSTSGVADSDWHVYKRSGVSYSGFTAQAGDRIIVEVWIEDVGAIGTDAYIDFAYNGGGDASSYSDGDVAYDVASFIEFSENITLSGVVNYVDMETSAEGGYTTYGNAELVGTLDVLSAGGGGGGSGTSSGSTLPGLNGGKKTPGWLQFERGIKFANVPGGKAENVVHGGPRVWHVSCLSVISQQTSDEIHESGMYSGVVKFRFRDNRRFPLPDSINRSDERSIDRFGNPVYPFTGRYGPVHIVFYSGSVYLQGSMAVRRSRYASGRLPDSTAIVAGGGDMSGQYVVTALSSSQVYSTGSGLWTALPDMPYAKVWSAGIVLSGSGDFFVLGGSTGSWWDDEEGRRGCLYIQASGAWYPTIASASVPRRAFEMVQIADGRVFIPGGLGASFTGSEFYLTGSNSFSGTLPIPLPPYNRELFTTTLLPDDSVLVVGGRDPVDLVPLPHAFRFYPSLLSWSIEPSMSIGRAGHATAVVGNSAYVIGGFDASVTASLPFMFPGPFGGTGEDASGTSQMEIYNITTSAWTSASASVPVSVVSPIVLPYGSNMLLLGGHNNLIPISGAYVYSTFDSVWYDATPLLTGVFDADAILLNPNDQSGLMKIIVPGGNMSGAVSFSGSQLYTTTGTG